MYICEVCGISFDDESGGTECFYHNEVSPGYTESFLVCPACGSSRYRESFRCERCGKPVLEEDLRGGYFCDDCLDEMTTIYHLRLYAKEMRDDFAEWLHERRANAKRNQLDYLNLRGRDGNKG